MSFRIKDTIAFQKPVPKKKIRWIRPTWRINLVQVNLFEQPTPTICCWTLFKNRLKMCSQSESETNLNLSGWQNVSNAVMVLSLMEPEFNFNPSKQNEMFSFDWRHAVPVHWCIKTLCHGVMGWSFVATNPCVLSFQCWLEHQGETSSGGVTVSHCGRIENQPICTVRNWQLHRSPCRASDPQGKIYRNLLRAAGWEMVASVSREKIVFGGENVS